MKLSLLDLSLNNLRVVSPSAFTGLNLDYLFLGDNPSITLPENGFTSLSTEIIDLKNNRLTEITPAFFTPLIPKLRKLFMNGNRIKKFSSSMINIFGGLETIRIQENPLVCDCESRWLKQFFDQNIAKMTQTNDNNIEPRCSGPLSLSGEFFSRLTLMDFLCDKPTLNSEISFDKTKGTLRCTSTGHPTPKISWYRPSGVIEVTFPEEEKTITEADLEVLASEPQTHGVYKCVAANEAGNVSLTVDVTWPFEGSDIGIPCADSGSTTSKEVLLTNGPSDDERLEQDADVFKKKYFTIIDIIIAVFGTFAGTLVVTVVVLHMCVYRKRKSASQYSTPPQSEYSASSMKNEMYPPPSSQNNMQIHTMQNRPLPQPNPKPVFHKAYDENHYMSTQLEEQDELAIRHQHQHQNSFGGVTNSTLGTHTNGGLVASPHSPPCQACQTMNTHHHHNHRQPQQAIL